MKSVFLSLVVGLMFCSTSFATILRVNVTSGDQSRLIEINLDELNDDNVLYVNRDLHKRILSALENNNQCLNNLISGGVIERSNSTLETIYRSAEINFFRSNRYQASPYIGQRIVDDLGFNVGRYDDDSIYDMYEEGLFNRQYVLDVNLDISETSSGREYTSEISTEPNSISLVSSQIDLEDDGTHRLRRSTNSALFENYYTRRLASGLSETDFNRCQAFTEFITQESVIKANETLNSSENFLSSSRQAHYQNSGQLDDNELNNLFTAPATSATE